MRTKRPPLPAIAAWLLLGGATFANDAPMLGRFVLSPHDTVTIASSAPDRFTWQVNGNATQPLAPSHASGAFVTGPVTLRYSGALDALVLNAYGHTVTAPRAAPEHRNAPSVLAPAINTPPLEDAVALVNEVTPRWMIAHRVPGVSVTLIEDNAIAWTGVFGVKNADRPHRRVTTRTVFEACSMSKPLFGYAALKLVEEGRLDLDRPLIEYLDKPYLPDD
ncbi:MAG: serine hydrolase, partial [Planctomycetota bacterium]